MSKLKNLSQITVIATLALSGLSMYQSIAQAATFSFTNSLGELNTGVISIYDPGSSSDYLGSGTLTGTALATGAGYQYNFTKALTGNYAGVSISGTVSVGEIDYFVPTGGAQASIANMNSAKIFKLSNLIMTNNSSQTLNYSTGINKRLFSFSNTFGNSFDLEQFSTVVNGQVGKVVNGNFTNCSQTGNFNIQMQTQGLNAANTVKTQQFVSANMTDSTCGFNSKLDNSLNNFVTITDTTTSTTTADTSYKKLAGFINNLILPSGYTFKMTNSFNLLATNLKQDHLTDNENYNDTPQNQEPNDHNSDSDHAQNPTKSLSDQEVEDLINVAIGKPISDRSFKFKVFTVNGTEITPTYIAKNHHNQQGKDQDHAHQDHEDQDHEDQDHHAQKVPEPSALFSLVAVGGLLISGIKKQQQK